VTTARTVATAGVLGTVRAMAGDVVVFGRPGDDRATPDPAVGRALEVFLEVHRTCTRFDPASPLMQVNTRPGDWHTVPPVLFEAVRAAHTAYEVTGGSFDPRVLGDLVRLGYDRTLPFAEGVDTPAAPDPEPRVRVPWRPRFRKGRRPRIHLGGVPVDLGGIGKGLAVRWASARLREGLDDFLVDAGGDCHCQGTGPEIDGWRVGVEDPAGGDLPVAVLALRDRACATSSTRIRRWRSAGRPVHHLLDPVTGMPGGHGLAAVTVVSADTADAEVTTKSLFLGGADGIADAARSGGVAALWVTTDGTCTISEAMAPHVVWRAA
jgi:thiamine biosynthesis lipoprotein